MPIKRRGKELLLAIAVLLFWILVLWVLSLLFDNPLLLPSPFAVLSHFRELLFPLPQLFSFLSTVLFSLLRILLGLCVGIVAGSAIGLLSFLLPAARRLLHPLLAVIRSTPVASLVILIWSITGGGSLPLVIAAMMITPIVADELLTGLDAKDSALLEVAELYRFSPWRRLVVLHLPAALPYFLSAIVTSVGFAWKAGIAAEILATTARSIGREIYFSKAYLETLTLWAWTLTVVVLSVILEKTVKKTLRYIERRAGWAS